ncbi:MAG: hypothetical protein IJV27_02025 [Prevotella sp.]|nr:hypothetical protein [Prevotella sp.]
MFAKVLKNASLPVIAFLELMFFILSDEKSTEKLHAGPTFFASVGKIFCKHAEIEKKNNLFFENF